MVSFGKILKLNMIVEDFDFKGVYPLALDRAKEMVKNGLYSRFGLSEEVRVEKAFLGCMGELAFEHFIKTKNISYELDTKDFQNRNSDEFDFLVCGKKVDIKVAKKTTPSNPNDNWTYGYPQEQDPVSKDYIVVGWIDFKKEEVGFYGWITGKKISAFPVVEKNSFAGYAYLTPNHEFKWGELNKNFSEFFQKINL